MKMAKVYLNSCQQVYFKGTHKNLLPQAMIAQ
jgi:hypothetical protein